MDLWLISMNLWLILMGIELRKHGSFMKKTRYFMVFLWIYGWFYDGEVGKHSSNDIWTT